MDPSPRWLLRGMVCACSVLGGESFIARSARAAPAGYVESCADVAQPGLRWLRHCRALEPLSY